MKIAVLKYNAGNVRSVLCALDRLGFEGLVTDSEAELRSADRVIFPGVGEASSAMKYLRETGLGKVLKSLTSPVLGICLGMQLMCRQSEENNTGCLDIFDVPVLKFPSRSGFKVPHMGWNTIKSSVFQFPEQGIENKEDSTIKPWCYFVHSYYVPTNPYMIASCTYEDMEFCAAIARDNFMGVQFHPEKSSHLGELILRDFIENGKPREVSR